MTRVLELGFPVAVVVVICALIAVPHVAGAGSQSAGDPVDLPRNQSPPDIAPGSAATINGAEFASAQAAITAAEPGETVRLTGEFTEQVVVDTPNLRLRAGPGGAVIDGGGEGRVLTIDAANVTVTDLWIRNSGAAVGNEDAGVFVNGTGTTLQDLYMSDIAFGIWVDGVDEVMIEGTRIEGRSDVYPLTDRGNGIQLWETRNTTVRDNEITAVRDGIYYSWAQDVVSRNNTIWNTRFGVHYMYSDDNRLVNNVAVDNDVGYALMISRRLEVVGNVALRNDGTSGHGLLLKGIEESTIAGNELVANRNGVYVYNAQQNEILENLVMKNTVGVFYTAGSAGQAVIDNTFVANGKQVLTTTTQLERWNDSERGNYWADARVADVTGDGISDLRHRPAGIVEQLVLNQPQAAVFTESPAFDAIRLAESSFPIVETPGVVDQHPRIHALHDPGRYADVQHGEVIVVPRTEEAPTEAHHDDH